MGRLNELALKYGTDKSSNHHNYMDIYEKYFDKLKDNDLKILEIGVARGRSLRTWEEYFTKAKIYGIDIKEKCEKYSTERIKIFIGKQNDINLVNKVIDEVGELDIIIDDGSHTMIDQKGSCDKFFPFLKEGGIYIIEDLCTSYRRRNYNGGFRNVHTTIEFLKRMLDTLHYEIHGQCWDKFVDKIYSIHMYKRIAFIFKKRG